MQAKAPVLIVDDDADIREALLDTFLDEGHPAVALPDGPSALTYLRSQPRPCLVLLDWNMTPMNGGEVMVEMRATPALAAVPVVLVTADMRVEQKAATPGFVACLTKPVDVDALFELVHAHCRS
ncbi:MAG: response regulator [Myxococcota bacterium]|nr:response regulator [Myxococcota bacterium]